MTEKLIRVIEKHKIGDIINGSKIENISMDETGQLIYNLEGRWYYESQISADAE